MSYKIINLTCQKFETDWILEVIKSTGELWQLANMGSVDLIVANVPDDIADFLLFRYEKLNPEYEHSDTIKSFARTNPNFIK